MTAQQISFPAFDYSAMPFSRWAMGLDELKSSSGQELIRTHIFWGEHEQIRGVRDFSQASRLRLERYLGLLAERELSVDLVIGFPVGGKTFPEWTYALESKEVVFDSICGELSSGLSLRQVPAWDDEELIAGFLDFIRELLSLVALYQFPGGPVKGITIDLGICQSSLSSISNSGFADGLASRYRSVSWLNQVYGTNFRDFKAVATTQGFRVLGDKRPWLSAFAYKSAQAFVVNKFVEQILEMSESKGLESIIKVRRSSTQAPNQSRAQILLDATLLGESPLGIFPFAPEGQLKNSALMVYRLYRYLEQKAKSDNIDLLLLPYGAGPEGLSGELAVVVCGKYLSSFHKKFLDDFVEQGGKQLFFPFGLPQYDEEMKAHHWVSSLGERVKTTPSGSLAQISNGLWIENSPLDYGDELWKQITTETDTILTTSSCRSSP